MRHGFGVLNWNQLRDSYSPVTKDEYSSALAPLYSLNRREDFWQDPAGRLDGAEVASQRSKRREPNVLRSLYNPTLTLFRKMLSSVTT